MVSVFVYLCVEDIILKYIDQYKCKFHPLN